MKVQTGSARRTSAPQWSWSQRGVMPVVAAVALVGATTLAVAPLPAQGPGVFEVMASRKQQPTEPLFGGIALARYHGPLGLRLSGALNLTSAQDSSRPVQPGGTYCRRDCRGPRRGGGYGEDNNLSMLPSIGAWTADVDLIFAPVRSLAPLRALLLGFSPYGFAGVGGYGVRPVNAADTTHATWSLGGGAHHQLLGWLGVGAEARYRQPFTSDSAFTQTWQDKLEYRVGLTVSFGGHHDSAPLGDTVSEPPAGARCGRVPCGSESAPAIVDPRFASRVLDIADGLVDTPFATGGTTPRSGFDAAGFVRYVFGQQGVSLPRAARDMASAGADISTRVGALRAGDLLFFANDGTNINHVAIYAGRDRIIHATASGNGVRYDTLGEGERGRWFAEHLVSARRLSPGSEETRPNADVDPSDRPDRAPRPRGASR